MSTATEQMKADAIEFGRHVKQGGWRLGLLVARNVERSNGGRPSETRTTVRVSGKVSGEEFARLSGVSRPKVLRYLDAWEAAAHLGHVPHADTLTPDQEIDLDAEELPAWGDIYKTDPRNTSRAQYHTRTVLKDPEQRRQVIASLPSEQIEEVIEEAHGVAMERMRAKQAERDTTPRQPTAGDLMGGDPFDPSESWLDVHIIRVRSKAHALAHQAQKWGVVLGSMTEEEAFEAVQEAERNIAEVRVALQERLRDRDRSEV